MFNTGKDRLIREALVSNDAEVGNYSYAIGAGREAYIMRGVHKIATLKETAAYGIGCKSQ